MIIVQSKGTGRAGAEVDIEYMFVAGEDDFRCLDISSSDGRNTTLYGSLALNVWDAIRARARAEAVDHERMGRTEDARRIYANLAGTT